MIADLIILAQQPERETPGWGTLIYVVIFLLIWIISAIVNVLNKRQQRRRAEMEEDEDWEPVSVEEPRRHEVPPPPPRMPERPAPPRPVERPVERRVERPPVVVERRPPPRRAEPAPPPLPRPEMPRTEMPRTQRQVRQAPQPRREFPTGATARQPDRRFPTPQRRVPVTETQVSTEVLRQTEIGSGGEQRTATGRPVSSGAPAVARLLQPSSLQQNFILTEILQSPKGLRPPE